MSFGWVAEFWIIIHNYLYKTTPLSLLLVGSSSSLWYTRICFETIFPYHEVQSFWLSSCLPLMIFGGAGKLPRCCVVWLNCHESHNLLHKLRLANSLVFFRLLLYMAYKFFSGLPISRTLEYPTQ